MHILSTVDKCYKNLVRSCYSPEIGDNLHHDTSFRDDFQRASCVRYIIHRYNRYIQVKCRG